MDYKQAAALIKERRKAELLEAGALFDELLLKDKELYDVETELRRLNLEAVKKGKSDKTKTDSLEKKKKAVLKKIGITEAMLSPSPKCAVCKDTAFKNGEYCKCVKNLAINSGGGNIKIKLNSFSEIDGSLYSEKIRERNMKLINTVRKIAETYPNNKKRNILLLGPTGTGKTFLAGCTADTMLKRGFSVLAVSAFEFVNRMLSYHTTFDDKKLSYITPVLDASLLIIDDLGTESIFKNVTLEYLYITVSERMQNGRLTVITSNLSKDAVLSRYGERLYSRLFDKELSYADNLAGEDIRNKKRAST